MSNITELRILDHEIYNINDKVFFIINSADNPTGFVICYGEIVEKDAKNLNVIYLIRLLDIIEEKTTMLKNFHYKTMKVFQHSSKTFRKVKFNILDVVDSLNRSEELQLKTMKYLFHSPSYLVTRNKESAIQLKAYAEFTAKATLEELLKDL
jgi:hypothetical protein